METFSELYEVIKIPEFRFTLIFKTFDYNQQKFPGTQVKLWSVKYQTGSFCGGCKNIKLVTYEDNIAELYILQRYVVQWNHTSLINNKPYNMDTIFYQHL